MTFDISKIRDEAGLPQVTKRGTKGYSITRQSAGSFAVYIYNPDTKRVVYLTSCHTQKEAETIGSRAVKAAEKLGLRVKRPETSQYEKKKTKKKAENSITLSGVYGDVTKTYTEWAKFAGISYSRLWNYIDQRQPTNAQLAAFLTTPHESTKPTPATRKVIITNPLDQLEYDLAKEYTDEKGLRFGTRIMLERDKYHYCGLDIRNYGADCRPGDLGYIKVHAYSEKPEINIIYYNVYNPQKMYVHMNRLSAEMFKLVFLQKLFPNSRYILVVRSKALYDALIKDTWLATARNEFNIEVKLYEPEYAQ